jgi:phage terminase large subunit-like protein
MLAPNEFVKSNLKKLDEYINGIVNGSITCNKYERLAVDRFLKFKTKYQYREAELIKVLKFFSLLNIANGNKIEQITLLPHQCFWLANFYALWNGGNRLFSTAYIETAKKSGKSSFSSCLSIYESIGAGVLNSGVILGLGLIGGLICGFFSK